ncbi:hypothetical protein Tco_1136611 [Tanacetum coccineum]
MEEDNKLKTKLEKIRSQIIKLQRKQLGQRDKITFAHYRISNLEQSIEENQAHCAEENKVTFTTDTLTNDALSWWNSYAQPIGIDQVNQITWTELKRLLTNKYCPRTEVKKMEDVFYKIGCKDLRLTLEDYRN